MKKAFFLTLFIFLGTLVAISQNNYYVAVNGSDSNDGSISSPWLTIQYGVNQLMPQDTLFIKAGTYEEKIDIDVSGDETGYITIRNYPNDEVILDAINFNNSDSIIWTDNSYLRIEGLHLTNNIKNNATGLEIQGAAHHIEVINNKISNIRFSSQANPTVTPSKNAVPLNVWADQALDSIHNITIRGNEVFNNQTGYSECITGGGNFSTFIIEENIVHDNTNIGIDITGNYGVCSNPNYDQGRYGVIRNNEVYNCNASYSASAGIYIDGGRDVIVENNRSHHNGYGAEIGCEENGSTSNITLRNNVLYQNSNAGISLGGYDDSTTGIVLNANIYGNTFYKNDLDNNYNGEILLTKLDNCEIKNNIFYVSSQNVLLEAGRTQTNFIFDYNVIYHDAANGDLVVETTDGSYDDLTSYYNASGQGEHSLFGNPLFVDSSAADFHILENSIAIDAGDPSYNLADGEVDMDHQNRIYNIIDCGADEYNSNLSVNNYALNIVITPNPTHNIITINNLTETLDYKIYSIYGSIVSKGTVRYNQIDLSKLKKGIYILNLINPHKKQYYTEKIIKY